MPRRAHFVFHHEVGFIRNLTSISFQCPEGLILYFTWLFQYRIYHDAFV